MILNKLISCGLTKSEAQIYLALLQKKEFTSSELSSVAPVGRTRIYEIIPMLITKGLCSEIQKDGKKSYYAIEPNIALQNLATYQRDEFEKKMEEQNNLINQVTDNLEEIYNNNVEKSDKLDYIELIKNKAQIRKKWLDLQANAESEELVFNKLPYSITPAENLEHESSILKNNVVCKGIYEYGDLLAENTRDDFINLLETYSAMGEEVHVIDKLPMKLAIIDERVTMLALNDPVSLKPSITTMIITHPSFASAQKEVFESYWNKSIPFEEFKRNIKK